MPASLGIPPWLQPPDVGRQFLGGAQIGVEQARIGQAAQHLQAQVNQQEQQRLEEQQRMEIAHEYQQQQLGLRRQQLQQAQQISQMKVQEAARQGQAMMAYSRGVQEVDARQDLSPEQKQQAKISLMQQHGPQMSEGRMSGMASMLKQMAPPPSFNPRDVDLGGGHRVFESAPNKFTEYKAPSTSETPDQREVDKAIAVAESSIKDIEKDLRLAKASGNVEQQKELEEQIQEKQQYINQRLYETKRPIRYDKVEGQPSRKADAASVPKFKVLKIAPAR